MAEGNVPEELDRREGRRRAGTVALRRELTGDRPRERMAELQRARILAATYEVCAQRGAGAVTVAAIVAQAGVSRRTFYELFESSEACLLAALEQAVAAVRERVAAAYGSERRWRARMRASLVALLAYCDEQPLLARLLLVEAAAVGPAALRLRARMLEPVVAAVHDGARERRAGALVDGRGEGGQSARAAARERPAQSRLLAETIVGGVAAILHDRVLAGEPARLVELTGDLMAIVVLPYLGAAASAAELGVEVGAPPQPPVSALAFTPARDPMQGLGMRLTYRTLRVLSAIAERPGASNRQVGRAAGVEDQGQISKLLRRLQGFGLVENGGEGPGKGAPNAWGLTERGRGLCEAVGGDGRAGGVGGSC